MVRRIRAVVILVGIALAAFVLIRSAFWIVDPRHGDKDVLVVGSKVSTDSVILAELIAQWIEHRLQLRVVRRLELGSTQICFEALRTGEIDIYPEYTGTALTTILEQRSVNDRTAALNVVRKLFAERYHLVWLEPLGFDNSYVLAMREEAAEQLGIRKISDLRNRDELVAGFDPEFLARSDGYQGLRRVYGLRFRQEPKSIEQGLVYQAIASGHVDVISAYSADGRIASTHLATLEDDLHLFPPYEPASVVRESVLANHPGLRAALLELKGRVRVEHMRELSLLVQSRRQSVGDVVGEFISRSMHSQ